MEGSRVPPLALTHIKKIARNKSRLQCRKKLIDLAVEVFTYAQKGTEFRYSN